MAKRRSTSGKRAPRASTAGRARTSASKPAPKRPARSGSSRGTRKKTGARPRGASKATRKAPEPELPGWVTALGARVSHGFEVSSARVFTELARALRSEPGQRVVSVALFALLFAMVSVRVRDRVQADRRYRVSKASLKATAPPQGMDPVAVHDLAQIPVPGRSFSVYDEDAVSAIAAAYRGLPWVREVRRIELDFPARLRFDLAVRRPAAALVHQGQTYLVDHEGVVLPADRYRPNDPRDLRLPVLVDAPLGPRSLQAGETLLHVPVQHGLSVARSLGAENFDKLFQGPVEIDVSNVDGVLDPRRSEIIVRAGSTTIEWGRAPLTDRMRIPATTKLQRLQTLIEREEDLTRLSLIRLQFDDVEWIER